MDPNEIEIDSQESLSSHEDLPSDSEDSIMDANSSSSESFGDNSSNTSSDTDEDLREMHEEFLVAAAVATAAASTTRHFFNSNEFEEQSVINPAEGTRDILATLRASPWSFKIMTNFTEGEWDELCTLVLPTIKSNARSTGLSYVLAGRPSKLTAEQRLLNFVLFMKHDNTVQFESFNWNWNRSSVCDDSIFVASCINAAIPDEIRWPSLEERRDLAQRLPQFPGCIGFIDGTLVKIRRPFNNPEHSRWFNGRKKMYSINNTVMLDHNGLFIHLDVGYPGSFHDVNILRNDDVYRNWRQHFHHEDNYFEFLLGDPGYLGEDHFIMRRIGVFEVHPGTNLSAVVAFNKMHAGFRVKVEWGIGGLKQKWRRLMKRFDSTKPKYSHIFYAAALLTNFLHRRRMDFSYEVVGERLENENEFGWVGDY